MKLNILKPSVNNMAARVFVRAYERQIDAGVRSCIEQTRNH